MPDHKPPPPATLVDTLPDLPESPAVNPRATHVAKYTAPDCPHLNPPDDVLAAAWKVRRWMDEVFPPNESAQLCGLTRSPAR